MEINGRAGKRLAKRYLAGSKLAKRLEHSFAVGKLTARVAGRIAEVNPELNLDVALCVFLGYVHDIGYSVAVEKHEVHTVELLQQNGIDLSTAQMAMHGQLIEQFGEAEGRTKPYEPVGIPGIILTFCDMSVRVGQPVTVRERAEEIVERVKAIPTIGEALKTEIIDNLGKALPRFERYERIVLTLAGLESVRDF